MHPAIFNLTFLVAMLFNLAVPFQSQPTTHWLSRNPEATGTGNYLIYNSNGDFIAQSLNGGDPLSLINIDIDSALKIMPTRDVYDIASTPIAWPLDGNFGFYHGIWSEDRQKIIYLALQPEGPEFRISLHQNGQNLTLFQGVMSEDMGYLEPIAWAGDDQVILLERYILDGLSSIKVYRLSLTSGELTRIAEMENIGVSGKSLLSPDGSTVFLGADLSQNTLLLLDTLTSQIFTVTTPLFQNTRNNLDQVTLFHPAAIVSTESLQQILGTPGDGITPDSVSTKANRPSPFLYWPLSDGTRNVLNYPNSPWQTYLGLNTYSGHQGTDLMLSIGNSVYAAATGTVVEAYNGCPDLDPSDDNFDGHILNCEVLPYPFNSGLGYHRAGNAMMICHNVTVNGNARTWYTFYAHLKKDSQQIAKGQTATRGVKIAETGHSGISSDPHFHFEIRNASAYTDWDDPWGSSDAPHTNPDDGTVWVYQNGTIIAANSGGGGNPRPPESIWCANEGQRCNFSGTATVYYGANNSYYNKTGVVNGIDCNNDNFGDPISGVSKACYYVITGGGSDTTPPTGGFNAPGEGTNVTSRTVRIEGWGSDSGSGFNHAHFTAEYNGGWHVISPDFTSSPFGFDWDMCAAGVPNGSVTLGLDVWDNAGNAAYSPGGVRHFTKNVDCGSGGSGTWNADYYDTVDRWWDNNNSGNYRCSENVGGPTLDKNYGNGTACGMDPDSWVAEYRATINFPAGNYVFYIEHDDGMKLWLGNENIADRGSSGSSWVCPARYLSGDTSLRAMLREDGGDARIKVNWTTDTSVCIQPPGTPGNFRVTGSDQNNIALAWDDVSDETEYRIYEWNGSSFVHTHTVGAGQTTYTDSGLSCGTSHTYRLTAANSRGESGQTGDVTGSTAACPTAPSTPSNPTPVDYQTIERNNNTTLYWSTNGDSCSVHIWGGSIDITPSGGCSSLFLGEQRGGAYSWQVTATNWVGSTPGPVWHFNIKPYGPTNLNGAASSGSQINLSWSLSGDEPDNIDTYEIYADNGTWLGSVNRGVSSYNVTGLACNTAYGFYATAKRQGVSSNPSNAVYLMTQPCLPPASPSNLRLERVDENQIQLEWNDNSGDETGFRIERSTDGLNWTAIASPPANTTSYINYQLVYNTRYWYRVRAFNAAGNSGYSNEASTWTAPTAAPANLSAERIADTQIRLTWTDRASNEDGFRVERSTDGLNWTVIASPGPNTTSYTNYQLEYNTRYWYRVRAYNSGGNSGYSNEAWARTAATAAPANLSAARVADTQIQLTWTDRSSNEDGFRVERSTDGLNWSVVASPPANSTTYTNFQLEYNTRYWFRVRAYNSGGNSDYSNEASAWTAPLASPVDLSARRIADTQIQLTWTDRSTDEDGFRVERSTDGLNWTVVASPAANSTSYTNYQLEYNTRYYYRVRAFNAFGNSLYSNQASAWTVPLASPASLSAERAADTQIRLTWTDRASNEDGFRVERSTDGLNWSVIASPAANTTTYTNYQLEYNTRYWYRVRAFNAAGNSDFTNEASAWTSPLPSPANLAAERVADTQIQLTWTDRSTDEDGFRIERSTDGLNWSAIASPGPNTTSYTNFQLEYNTRYFYRVRAFNAFGNSLYTNQASAWTAPAAAPADLTAERVAATQIRLSWTDRSSNEDGFRVERSTDGLNWSVIASPAANATTYTNFQLEYNTRYYYRVRAYNSGGNSAYSNEAWARTAPLPAPTDLSASVIADTQILLTWTDRSDNEDGFKIERSTDNGLSWVTIATLGPNRQDYTNYSLNLNSLYFFRVRAFNINGNSTYSNQASAWTPPLNSPANLSLAPVAIDQINLSWSDRSSNESGFKIERSTNGSVWTQITTLPPNQTSFQNTGLSRNTTYFFRVRAFNAAGNSLYSNQASAQTVAAVAPSALSALPLAFDQIQLSWRDNSSNESGFKIEVASSPNGPWTQISTQPANVTSFTHRNLRPATTYYYRVRATNPDGNSAYSNIVSAVTPRDPNIPNLFLPMITR